MSGYGFLNLYWETQTPEHPTNVPNDQLCDLADELMLKLIRNDILQVRIHKQLHFYVINSFFPQITSILLFLLLLSSSVSFSNLPVMHCTF